MQSTLGNLPELFVVVFALKSGDLVVAQTAIVGSIFANGLLVLGIVFVIGARRAPDGVMRFKVKLPKDTATLLQVTVFILVLVALAVTTHNVASRHIEAISAVGAVCLLGVYLAWVVRYAREDKVEEGRELAPRISLGATLALLVVAGVASAFVSDWFVNALEPAIHVLNISPAFAGIVIIAIAGNAVENFTALSMAGRGRADLAISVVKNSVAQIAAFLYPLLVLISFALHTRLTFTLPPVYIGALLLTTLALDQITSDGEAAEFEGWALVALYVILAVVALFE
jgi:Ca2+:H+ antiporter